MRRRMAIMAAAAILAAYPLLADFSYQETTKVTGGMMVGILKVAGVFSKQAREPIQATVALKGNRLAHRSATHSSIIDLDSRTITEIDSQKKTYSVITFEQMKQMLADMSEKMKEKKPEAEMQMKVSANPTGKTRQIAGFDAKEMQMKIDMQTTDPKTGQSGSMLVQIDLWIAGGIPGYAEVRDFYRRMAAELDWTPGGSIFAAQPQVSKGMAEAMKEIAKLDGAPVLQLTSMGPEGTPPPTAAEPGSEPAAQPQKEKTSVGGALGGALGGRLGIGRKKSPPPEEQQQKGSAQSGGAASSSLIEMTTEYSGFSSGPADASLFEIPAGYKKVEPNSRRMQ